MQARARFENGNAPIVHAPRRNPRVQKNNRRPQPPIPNTPVPKKKKIIKKKLDTCTVCFDEKRENDFVTMQCCGNKFCRDCLVQMVDIAIRTRSTTDLRCPHPECRQEIRDDLRNITGNDVNRLSTLGEIRAQAQAQRDPNYRQCPTPDCEHYFIMIPQNRQNWMRQEITGLDMECPRCRNLYCSDCLQDHHEITRSCEDARQRRREQAERRREEERRRRREEALRRREDANFRDEVNRMDPKEIKEKNREWKKNNTKPCPNCKRNIQKTSGCNHMTCRCGQEFCYRCGSDYRNGCTCYGPIQYDPPMHYDPINPLNHDARPVHHAQILHFDPEEQNNQYGEYDEDY